LHRYDYGEFWPNLRQGDFDHIGEKDGKGFNVNIPLNKVKPALKTSIKINIDKIFKYFVCVKDWPGK